MPATDLQYLLDTNIVSDLLRNPQGVVFRHIARAGENRVCTSIVVACELRYGVLKRASKRLADQIEAVLSALRVLPLEPGVDQHYAQIRLALERRGTPIGANDLLIAAHARASALTLVTHDAGEFQRVPGLKVRDWLAA